MSTLLLTLALLGGPAGPDPVPPTLRLPEAVQPVRQAVDLTLDPEAESLAGTTEIALELKETVLLVWLNSRGLTISEASLDTGGGPVPARVVPGNDDVVGFSLDRPLAPGTAHLRVRFEAPISRRDGHGVFAREEAGDWYLFTQFQAVAARQAFPCFDEPGHKIPWQVTLRVPSALVALSNAPVEETAHEAGRTVLRFRETPPLPSYLVAFAVGPFEVVELGRLGRNRTPSRLVVPRGRGVHTAWASATTPLVLTLLEEYFDDGYPYAKLDQLAVPGMGGAMEHPGLVTYGQGLLVRRPSEQTLSSRRDWVVYCAHELAHMWFGNLVTMEWWDDTWLNEAFAMWMEDRITGEARPEWEMDLERVRGRATALEADSLSTARRVRQPIESRHDIHSAFDGITYYKGKAVLEMVESWVGEEAFRRGVGDYLVRHAWGNASADDLIGALSTAAGRDLEPTFSSFLDQVGAPLVSAAVSCEEGPRIVLQQEPYRPLGSAPAPDRRWDVPVCTASSGASGPWRGCRLLASERDEQSVGVGGCPEWALANAGMRGYYRLALGREQAEALLVAGRLSPAERLGLADDLGALVASGDLAAGDALFLATVLARDLHPQVVLAGLDLLVSLESVVPDRGLEAYRSLLRREFGPRARDLGWSPVEGEGDDTVLLRARLLRAVGARGQDEDLGREALDLARGWLRDEAALSPDMIQTVLGVAARHADRAFFEELRHAALAEEDRQRSRWLLSALGEVGDPALAREALGLLLEEQVDPRQVFDLAGNMNLVRATRGVLWDFLQENWEPVTARLPRVAVGYLPALARRICDADQGAALEVFLRPRLADFGGGPRRLDQAIEQIDQCVARRAAQQESALVYLQETVGDSGDSD